MNGTSKICGIQPLKVVKSSFFFLRLLRKKSRDLNVRKSRKVKCCGNLKLRSDESEENFTEIFVLFNVTHYIAYIVHAMYTMSDQHLVWIDCKYFELIRN